MIAVLIAALVLTLGRMVPQGVDPVLLERGFRLGMARHFALILVLTGVVVLPFAIAAALVFAPVPTDRVKHRLIVRWFIAALAGAVGLAILNHPLDGLRIAYLLKDGTCVTFYHQYRIWPGRQVTPCFELIAPTGKSRSYPIARNTRYQAYPDVRTNADQSVIWLTDNAGARSRYGRVWCSINRTKGEFVGAGGPYPTVVSETPGISITR